MLRGSKEIIAAIIALIKYSENKFVPAKKCQEFLKNTSCARFLSMKDEDIERFKKAAKPYGLRFLHLQDSNGDGLSTVMVRGEDAAIINRIIDRLGLNMLSDVSQKELEVNPDKAKEINEPVPEIVVGKDSIRVEDAVSESRASAADLMNGIREEKTNPQMGRTETEKRPSESSLNYSGNRTRQNEGTDRTNQNNVTVEWTENGAKPDPELTRMIEEKRNKKIKVLNQNDPPLNAPAKTKPSVRKQLEAAKAQVSREKAQRAAAEKKVPQIAVKPPVHAPKR